MHIYDSQFITGGVPITKQEVRAVSIAKLQLNKDSILIDVGAGTGSISIEAATYLESGEVYAIERKEEGCDLITANKEKFGCKNINIIHGLAPSAIPNISYNRMFIGGNGGELREILIHFNRYATDDGILVINLIALESLMLALPLLKELNFKDIEICNVNISRGKIIAGYTMMMGENPIYIIKAKKG